MHGRHDLQLEQPRSSWVDEFGSAETVRTRPIAIFRRDVVQAAISAYAVTVAVVFVVSDAIPGGALLVVLFGIQGAWVTDFAVKERVSSDRRIVQLADRFRIDVSSVGVAAVLFFASGLLGMMLSGAALGAQAAANRVPALLLFNMSMSVVGLLGVTTSLHVPHPDETRPMERLRASTSRALKVAVPAALLILAVQLMSLWYLYGAATAFVVLSYWSPLVVGGAWLLGGGAPFFQFRAMMAALARSGQGPSDYPAFLEELEARRLLFRRGASYSFIHVSLRDHLAVAYERDQRAASRRRSEKALARQD